MEDLCKRIPLISKIICEELDDQCLVKFKDTSREIATTMKNERFYWLRVLRTYNCLHGDFRYSWARVVKRTSAEFVEEIARLVNQFYMSSRFDHLSDSIGGIFFAKYYGFWGDKHLISFSPQHIAAYSGKVDFYKHCVEKICDLNPKEQISGLSPLHFAACHGKLEVCQFIIANLDEKIQGTSTTSHHFMKLQSLATLQFADS